MCMQNSNFVALPVPKIIWGTRKNWVVPGYAHDSPMIRQATRQFFLSGGAKLALRLTSSTEVLTTNQKAAMIRLSRKFVQIRFLLLLKFVSLQKSAERNKKYYDIGVKPNQFEVGQWVLYFNPRKFRGKQNKWIRQYEGPFLVIATPSS